MRKRSGAIHSDSEQEYLRLAEQMFGTLGFFYDEKISFRAKKMYEEGQSENFLKEFNFNVKDQLDLDFQEEQEVKVKTYVSVIICDSIIPIFGIMGIIDKVIDQNTQLDLLMHKIETTDGTTLIFKYWIMTREFVSSPLARVYIAPAKKVFEVHEGPACEFEGITTIKLKLEEFKQRLIEEQQKQLNC